MLDSASGGEQYNLPSPSFEDISSDISTYQESLENESFRIGAYNTVKVHSLEKNPHRTDGQYPPHRRVS